MALRHLVVCCDGTWNEPESVDAGVAAPTNVVKFANALASRRGRQVVHYEEGVGTRAWEALPGGVYGYGLEKRIHACYRFLRRRIVDDGEDPAEQRVHLFGFSRGAYTVRRLAGLLAHSGLPRRAGDAELGVALYERRDAASAAACKADGRFFDVAIEEIGVWDTVKATNDGEYHDGRLSPNVRAGYHAMAIDERRRFFPVLRWDADPRVLQVWFAGVHADVGGGYATAGLSDVALRWMIERAVGHGLAFKQAAVDALAPAPAAAQHESYQGIWTPLGTATRTVAAEDWVHGSVRERLRAGGGYAPANLPDTPRWWPAA